MRSAIPVDRTGGRASRLRSTPDSSACARVRFRYLPRGTRSPDGRLYRGKTESVAAVLWRPSSPLP